MVLLPRAASLVRSAMEVEEEDTGEAMLLRREAEEVRLRPRRRTLVDGYSLSRRWRRNQPSPCQLGLLHASDGRSSGLRLLDLPTIRVLPTGDRAYDLRVVHRDSNDYHLHGAFFPLAVRNLY